MQAMEDVLKLTPASIDYNYQGEVMVFDLDDTLYSEYDYMLSGFEAIVRYELGGEKNVRQIVFLEKMVEAFQRGENALEKLAESLNINPVEREEKIKEWVRIYREHKPEITLSFEVREVLKALSLKNLRLAIITDGRSISQRNKIEALGLTDFFEDNNIFISEEHAKGKESMEPFSYMEHIFPNASSYIYVADNPQKDFFYPNLMGWKTVCLRDKGKNIHPQDIKVSSEYLPSATIDSFKELLTVK